MQTMVSQFPINSIEASKKTQTLNPTTANLKLSSSTTGLLKEVGSLFTECTLKLHINTVLNICAWTFLVNDIIKINSPIQHYAVVEMFAVPAACYDFAEYLQNPDQQI